MHRITIILLLSFFSLCAPALALESADKDPSQEICAVEPLYFRGYIGCCFYDCNGDPAFIKNPKEMSKEEYIDFHPTTDLDILRLSIKVGIITIWDQIW